MQTFWKRFLEVGDVKGHVFGETVAGEEGVGGDVVAGEVVGRGKGGGGFAEKDSGSGAYVGDAGVGGEAG